MFTVATMIKPT